jgi:hypothetical protein
MSVSSVADYVLARVHQIRDVAVSKHDRRREMSWLVWGMEVTQQARHELARCRAELDPTRGRILALEVDDRDRIRVEERQPGPAEVVVRDDDHELLFIEHRLHSRLEDTILHFSSAADSFDGAVGWVLLKPRGTAARPGLADSLRESVPDREPAGVWRLVKSFGAALHPAA